MRIEGTREAQELLGGIAARLRDPSPALRAEADRMLEEAREAIETRTAPDGTRWPEPRRTTATRPGRRARPRSGGGRSGRLASSGRVSTDDEAAVLAFDAPYAGHVQDSGRAFVPFDGEDPQDAGSLEGIEERLADWVIGGRS